MASSSSCIRIREWDEELKDVNTEVKTASKNRITFCVEGNISVGKTTFLHRIVRDTIELRDLVEVVPEPIDKWQDVGPDHFNILDAFYAEPHRYAYTFQNYVFVTRVMQERESSGGVKPLRLMERSIFSDRMVPALVLDCEANIDFSRDIEAKEHYAHQVAEFFKYVKNRKEVSPSKPGEGGLNSNRQVLLPHEGGLFLPSKRHFPESALKSLDFRRTMSFMSGQ
ncbi:hypothetical protein GH714_017191 [Hevea brasiliensis]|uniref:Deoxynucleoside kinase domain-containing protein n=1 Tax=Hevea brasiliensis TaxID=3981 RepID=A0A6A6KPL9_HEVBR|nr:hypothetical protein GH714_017191 [Hevea brasiliensis]